MPSHEKLTRHLAAAARSETDGRRYTLSFSSEDPYERLFGIEILDHAEGAVDLSRLSEIGVLLFNHNRNEVLGKVVAVHVEDSRGTALVEFDSDERAEAIRRKVESGTLKGVSVGYTVDVWEEVAAGKKSTCGRFDGPCFIARKWTPLEISIVSVPADPTVGVGRSAVDNINEREETSMPFEHAGAESLPTPEAGLPVDAERKRAAEITALCRDFGRDPTAHISDGDSLDCVRAAILEDLRKSHAPVAVGVIRDEGDKLKEAARDALLLRGGLTVDKPAEGARELRNLRLRDLMNRCAREQGVIQPETMDMEDLIRAFYSPDALFPAILDQTVQKAYEKGYNTFPATFDIWTVKGSLNDFKPTKAGYRMGGAGDFLPVAQGGEIKHDVPIDYRTPERVLKTYARQFTLSREALINDDIGFVTSIPARYAAAARRTLNKQVYQILTGNPDIYDGKPLFGSHHSNAMAMGMAVGIDTIREMIKMLMLQKSEDGEFIHSTPRYIICPVGEGDIIRQYIQSPGYKLVESGLETLMNNPLIGRGLEVIEDAQLNMGNPPLPWFMAADKSVIPAVQVDYLNGVEIPAIRRMERPGQLGFIWDFYLDWGITVVDYRGLVKNPGA